MRCGLHPPFLLCGVRVFMNPQRTLLPALLAAALLGARAPQAAPAQVAAIPHEVCAPERQALSRGAQLLSRGAFKPAAAVLAPLALPAVTRVFVDWAPVPAFRRAAYLRAVRQAVAGWNTGLGRAQFRLVAQERGADVRVLFERYVATMDSAQLRALCSEATLEVGPAGPQATRTGRIRIALYVPNTEAPHSAASIVHLAGQGLGVYLGLPCTEQEAALMGPDPHVDDAAVKPSAAEVRRAAELQRLRLRLLECARKRLTVRMAAPVLVADRPELDLGEIPRGETRKCAFRVRNTGQAALEIHVRPDCSCIVAGSDVVIPPGREGKVEAEVHTPGLRGPITKVLALQTNDPDRPQLSLYLLANVVSALQILPSEQPVFQLKDQAPTVGELELRVAGGEPLRITGVTCSERYATATATPAPGAPDGSAYRLAVTIGPEAPTGRFGILVRITTSSAREPYVDVTVTCEKGILPVPSGVDLGTLAPDASLPVSQPLMLLKRSGTFHVTKAQTDDPGLKVHTEAVREGSEYRITVTLPERRAAGSLQSKIVVDTDDPAQPRIEIPVTARFLAGTKGK